MINSMTGYGGADGEVDGVIYTVEIKTVNNRYFKTNIRLPETAAFLEEDIERLLRENLSRGTVNYSLRVKNASEEVLFDIDESAFRTYIERAAKAASSSGIECRVDIGSMLTLPGILSPISPDEDKAVRIKERVLSITSEAIEQLKQMRAAEGAALAADLKGHCEAIKVELEQIRSRSSIVPQEYAKKLKERVEGLLAEAKLSLDEEMLAREVAVFADRSDISEELARLESHLQQFTESCQSAALAGRRLDFISQEMLREANTIASKASDSQIAHSTVDVKCLIDRIKEQVQNAE